MKAVADSSPLIILAKLGCLDFLPTVYSPVYISAEVHAEIVVAGAGLPGANQMALSGWIKVGHIRNQDDLSMAKAQFSANRSMLKWR